jgi:hypothetical protein
MINRQLAFMPFRVQKRTSSEAAKKAAVHLASLRLTILRCSQRSDTSESLFAVLLICVKWPPPQKKLKQIIKIVGLPIIT